MVLHRFFFLLCIIGFGVFTNLHSITAQTNSPKTNSFYNGSTTNRFRLRVEEFLSKGELDSALMYIHREMTTTNNDTLQMDASWHLGRIFGRKGETTRMFEYFFQALDRAEKSNNLSKIALYCNAIGSMYAQYNLHNYAEEFLQRSKYIAETLGDPNMLAQTEAELGELYGKRGRYELMRDACLKGLFLIKTPNHSPEEQTYYATAYIHNKLAWAYLFLQDYDSAATHLDSALMMYAQTPVKRFIPDVYIVYAQVCVRQQQFMRALEYARRADTAIRQMGITILKIQLYRTFAEIADSVGDARCAYDYFRQSVQAERTIFSHQAVVQSDILRQEYERRLQTAQEQFWKNILLFSLALTLCIVTILIYLYRLKSKTNQQLRRQQLLLEKQAVVIQENNTQLSTKNLELERLHTLKNEFLGMAAHDLRNPLQGIAFSAEILQSHVPSGDALTHKHTERILTAAQSMGQMLQDLLDVNKIESGTLHLTPESLSTSSLELIVQSFFDIAAQKFILLTFENNAPESSIYADYRALQQVMNNIISNAIKYSPHHKNVLVSVEIEKRYSSLDIEYWSHNTGSTNPPMNSFVRIAISDEGPGFSEEDKSRMFQKFARLSAKPTGGEPSTGLGLAITKSLVEAMNGRIICNSTLGHGATFIVSLPQQQL